MKGGPQLSLSSLLLWQRNNERWVDYKGRLLSLSLMLDYPGGETIDLRMFPPRRDCVSALEQLKSLSTPPNSLARLQLHV